MGENLGYILNILMGIFSTFSGILYNDFMSIPLDYYSWYHRVREGHLIVGRSTKDWVLPSGVDFFWHIALNELSFTNSLKMKLSVIIGVAHITLGIWIKAINSIHFSKPLDFLFEFIPQLALFLSIFGFMDLLIILKWLYPWSDQDISSNYPPSIITIMFNMFLKQGEVAEKSHPLVGNADIQKMVCNILTIILSIKI